MDAVEWALLRSKLFERVDPATFSALRSEVETVKASAGEVIVREGDVGDAMYVVQRGTVQVCAAIEGGEQVVLAKLEAGSHFGEQALLPGGSGRRNASVRAHSDVELLRIGHASFQKLLADDHPLKEHLVALGGRQIRENLARSSTLFRALHDHGGAAGVEEVELPAGAVVFHEGDAADCVYLILSGRASVHRRGEQGLVRINTLAEGQCVGELALLRRSPRTATLMAETPLRLLRVPGRWFHDRLERSPELRAYLQTIERVYTLPRRGLVTQHAGRWMDRDAVTTLYHGAGGRRVAATRVIGEDLFQLEVIEADGAATASTELRHESEAPRVLRELRLGPGGEILGIAAHGYWAELPELLLRAVDGVALERVPDPAGFSATGQVWPRGEKDRDEERICGCVQVSRRTLVDAVQSGCSTLSAVQERTRCGTVCGACVPWVLELLGEGEWTPVRIRDELPVAEGIRSFRMVPLEGAVEPVLPGQHLVVKARIEGRWVQRAYTLTSPSRADHYEITVKREPRGTFSRWLFDPMDRARELRVSRPRGECVHSPESGRSVVCLVAGIGMTPALSMVRAVAAGERPIRVHVDYSARTLAEMAYGTELLELARGRDHVTVTLRETSRSGRLSAGEVAELAARHRDADFFVCGPEGYLASVTELLGEAGVARERVHLEAFTHAGDPPKPGAPAENAPAAALAPRTDAFADVLVPAGSPPRNGVVRGLKALAAGLSLAINHPFWDWRVGNLQLNPYRFLADRFAERVGVDARLPREYLCPLGTIGLGSGEHHLRVFARLRARGGPCVDTFAQLIPNPPLERYEGPIAVRTGWTEVFPGAFCPMIITRDPRLIPEILDHPARFDRGPLPYHHLQQIVGSPEIEPEPGRKAAGLFAGQLHDNATWKDDRKLGVQCFGAPMLDAIADVMQAALRGIGSEIDARLAKGGELSVDGDEMMLRIAFQMLVRSAFGEIDPTTLGKLALELRPSLLGPLSYVMRKTYGLSADRAGFEHDMTRARELVATLVDTIVADHAAGKLAAIRSPIIDLVVSGDGGCPMSMARLFPFLLVAMVAGHETTGHTMAWALYHLARDPSLLGRVRAEIDDFYRDRPERVLTSADYVERPLTQALMYELNRMHPPVVGIPRTALADDRLGGPDGFAVRKGTMVVVSFVGAHRHPDRWRDPDAFDVDRFLVDADPSAPLLDRGKAVWDHGRARERAFDLLTFSAGPGRCLGQDFNMLEFFLVLDFFVRRYDVELLDPGREVRDSPAELSGPEPGTLQVRLRKRG